MLPPHDDGGSIGWMSLPGSIICSVLCAVMQSLNFYLFFRGFFIIPFTFLQNKPSDAATNWSQYQYRVLFFHPTQFVILADLACCCSFLCLTFWFLLVVVFTSDNVCTVVHKLSI